MIYVRLISMLTFGYGSFLSKSLRMEILSRFIIGYTYLLLIIVFDKMKNNILFHNDKIYNFFFMLFFE